MAAANIEHIRTTFEQAIINRREVAAAKEKGKTGEGMLEERRAWGRFSTLLDGLSNAALVEDDVSYSQSETDKVNKHIAELNQRRMELVMRCEEIKSAMQQPNPEYVKAVTYGDSKTIDQVENNDRELLLELHAKQKQLNAMDEGKSDLLLERDVWERITKAVEKAIHIQALAIKDAELMELLPKIESLLIEMDELCSKAGKRNTHRNILANKVNPPGVPKGANPYI